MIYVFIFNMTCTSDKNKAVIQNQEKAENMFGAYFYQDSLIQNKSSSNTWYGKCWFVQKH